MGLLQEIETSGMGRLTASYEGIVFQSSQDQHEQGRATSALVMHRDMRNLEKYRPEFESAANITGMPVQLIMAICSRETHGKNIIGDNCNGIGLMQIDIRYHDFARTKQAMQPMQNIRYGAQLLARYQVEVSAKHPNWTQAECLRGAVAAYNSGVGNVKTYCAMDVGTTGGDYSSDVWARARAI